VGVIPTPNLTIWSKMGISNFPVEQGVAVEELKNLQMIYKTAQQERKEKVQELASKKL
jgi:hypothetical protein